jgi:hypothetical protein
MEIAKAQELFSLGNLDVLLVHCPDLFNNGWTLEIRGNIGRLNPIVETARKHNRCFKTLDAAAKAANTIGFKNFEVLMN